MSEQRRTYKVFIRGSAEAVWHEITKTESIQQCMFNSWLECQAVEAGRPFRMVTPSRRFAGVVGEIMEVSPPRRYVHTMRFTTLDEPVITVTHDIVPVAGGVEYQMTLDHFVLGSKSAKQAIQGMKLIADTLKALVETGRPPLGVRLLYALFRLMEPFSPAKIKSENFPT